jgi:uncharacterized protein
MMPGEVKTALVTGAASGFGFEFAKLLAADSYNMILVDIDASRLESVKDYIIQNYPVEVDVIVCDLAKPQAAGEIYYRIKSRLIDVLINNAGFGLSGFFTKTDWQTEEAMINLHILAITHLTKLFITDMVSRRSGRIMNISSVAAFQPGPLMAVYYASKSYILSFSEAIANEVKGTGVTVTVFCPGLTRTRFQENTAIHSNTKMIKIGRIASVKKVARIGYHAMLIGKTLSVPGIENKIVVLLNRIVSLKARASLVRYIQENIRK